MKELTKLRAPLLSKTKAEEMLLLLSGIPPNSSSSSSTQVGEYYRLSFGDDYNDEEGGRRNSNAPPLARDYLGETELGYAATTTTSEVGSKLGHGKYNYYYTTQSDWSDIAKGEDVLPTWCQQDPLVLSDGVSSSSADQCSLLGAECSLVVGAGGFQPPFGTVAQVPGVHEEEEDWCFIMANNSSGRGSNVKSPPPPQFRPPPPSFSPPPAASSTTAAAAAATAAVAATAAAPAAVVASSPLAQRRFSGNSNASGGGGGNVNKRPVERMEEDKITRYE